MERGGDKVVARRKELPEVAVGQTGNNKPIPITPITARNPAGKTTGTGALPACVSHPESDFRDPLYIVKHQILIWKRSTFCGK